MIYQIFPSLVYKENLISEMKDFDISKLEQFEKKEGFSVDSYVLNHKDILILKNIFLRHIDIYTKDILEIEKSVEFYITRSWITEVKEGEFTPTVHTHQNAFFTGVLYFNVEEEVDSIVFVRTKPHQYLSYGFEKVNKFNQEAVTFHPKKWDFIILDAAIPHHMGPIISKKTRNSLVMEIFARGTFGKCNVGNAYNVGELILR